MLSLSLGAAIGSANGRITRIKCLIIGSYVIYTWFCSGKLPFLACMRNVFHPSIGNNYTNLCRLIRLDRNRNWFQNPLCLYRPAFLKPNLGSWKHENTKPIGERYTEFQLAESDEQVPMETSHYNDVIMSAMASQITSLTSGYSSVYSGADQRKHQSSASLAFVWRIHRWPVNSPHKGPVTPKKISIWWRHHEIICFIDSWSILWL